MIQTIVIKNTFLSILEEDEDKPKRSQSAPPRLWNGPRADPAASASRRTRRAAAKAKRREQQEQDQRALEEFAAAARVERWTLLAAKLIAVDGRSRLASARASLLAADKPLMQLELTRELFFQMAALCFESEEDLMLLVRMGVLRLKPGGDGVQIWSSQASLHHAVMQSLILTGRGISALARDGVFQVCSGATRPIVLKFTARFRVEDLRGFLVVQGFRPDARLFHLRRPLGSHGLLSDYSVRPGSTILIETVVEQI
jgi:hypothetical protein